MISKKTPVLNRFHVVDKSLKMLVKKRKYLVVLIAIYNPEIKLGNSVDLLENQSIVINLLLATKCMENLKINKKNSMDYSLLVQQYKPHDLHFERGDSPNCDYPSHHIS